MIKIGRGSTDTSVVVELDGTGLELMGDLALIIRNWWQMVVKETSESFAKKCFEVVLEAAFSDKGEDEDVTDED